MTKNPKTKVILVQDFSNIRRERYAAGTITPGMLVEVVSPTGKVRAHSTPGGYANTTFAVRDTQQGKGINDNYLEDDLVSYHQMRAGDRVLAIVADSQNIAQGDFVESNGDGKVRKYNAGVRIGFATHALNTTATSSEDEPETRLIIEIV